VRDRDVKAIRFLVSWLGPDWCPLWETVNGKDRLVFISPALLQQYKDALGPDPDVDVSDESEECPR
jgi:hypothetical protein